MNYIPGKSLIRTRSLTSCQKPVCCGTLSNSKRGKQTHCCNVYFCPLPPEAENSTFSAKCGRRKFLQGTLFCKMHCVLHSFLAYMVFLWVVSRTDPGISLKYSRPAGNNTNDIWNKKDYNSKLIFFANAEKNIVSNVCSAHWKIPYSCQ